MKSPIFARENTSPAPSHAQPRGHRAVDLISQGAGGRPRSGDLRAPGQCFPVLARRVPWKIDR